MGLMQQRDTEAVTEWICSSASSERIGAQMFKREIVTETLLESAPAPAECVSSVYPGAELKAKRSHDVTLFEVAVTGAVTRAGGDVVIETLIQTVDGAAGAVQTLTGPAGAINTVTVADGGAFGNAATVTNVVTEGPAATNVVTNSDGLVFESTFLTGETSGTGEIVFESTFLTGEGATATSFGDTIESGAADVVDKVKKGLSAGDKAGIAVSVIAFCGLLAAALWMCMRRRSKKKKAVLATGGTSSPDSRIKTSAVTQPTVPTTTHNTNTTVPTTNVNTNSRLAGPDYNRQPDYRGPEYRGPEYRGPEYSVPTTTTRGTELPSVNTPALNAPHVPGVSTLTNKAQEGASALHRGVNNATDAAQRNLSEKVPGFGPSQPSQVSPALADSIPDVKAPKLPKVDLPKVDMPSMPKVDMPSIPKVDTPSMPSIPKVGGKITDAAAALKNNASKGLDNVADATKSGANKLGDAASSAKDRATDFGKDVAAAPSAAANKLGGAVGPDHEKKLAKLMKEEERIKEEADKVRAMMRDDEVRR